MDGWFSKLDERLEKHLGAENVAKLRTVIMLLKIDTGLTIKYEGSKTTLRNLNCLFPYIYDPLQLFRQTVFFCITYAQG